MAAGVLAGLRSERGQTEDPAAVDRLLDALAEVRPCPDAEPAFIRLREEGVRILVLTQGALDVTREMLRRHRLDAFVERVVSIEEVGRWKPCREVYDRLVDVAGGDHARVLLVSAHDWDVHGAARANLATAWVKRPSLSFSPVMGRPDLRGGSLVEVAQAILGLPPAGAVADRGAAAPPPG
ncbi:HAD hydrolase-like protein [Myxococcota bacterium]|nr:HAD hydrolase-like protein [Myxococcota bacterium]